MPIITDLPVAPDYMLQDIRCNCYKKKNLCNSCSCVKNRLTCNIHGNCEANCNNAGLIEADHLFYDNNAENDDNR